MSKVTFSELFDRDRRDLFLTPEGITTDQLTEALEHHGCRGVRNALADLPPGTRFRLDLEDFGDDDGCVVATYTFNEQPPMDRRQELGSE